MLVPNHWTRRLPLGSLQVAGALFAAIFALTLLDDHPTSLWSVLYAVPIVLVARDRGLAAGAVAAAIGFVLGFAGDALDAAEPVARDHLAHVVAFAGVAAVAARRPVAPAAAAGDDLDLRRREAQRLVQTGSWELDLATGEMQWSKQHADLYGVDPETFVASREAFRALVHKDDRKLLDDAIAQIARDGTTVEVRYCITRPSDGTVRRIRSHISARRDAAGTPQRVIATEQDVTDLITVLSARESEVLMLLAEGLSGEDIAARLFLSPATVRTHVQNAMSKLGAHTRGAAIATALRSDEIGS